jgi:tetratricopeptide (TPR) repeat protein
VEQAPFYADAVLLAAELNLDGGNAAGAIESLEKLLAAQPGVVNGYVILGRAYLSSSKRDLGKALQVFRKMETVAPKDPRAPYLIGVVLAAQGDMAEANRHFERSLAMAPGFVDPLIALVGQDMRANRADAALARVQKQIAAAPNASRLHYVLGEVQRTRRDFAAAETAYVRALELEPGLVAPYIELGRLYLTQQKEDQALAKFEQAARVNSADVVSRMMAAQIYMRRQDSVKAKATYEAILAAHPRFAPAANNLAYLYAQEPGKQDEALRLVQIAKEAAPNDPNISDTLGWLLFQRGVYDQAAALLRESAAKLPDNAEVLYHAGMAVHKVGDKVAARTFLAKAVASTAEFPGKSDARKALLELD